MQGKHEDKLPAHTWSGIEVSTDGKGVGGDTELGSVARHHGVFGGKFWIIGSRVDPPLGILVIAYNRHGLVRRGSIHCIADNHNARTDVN